MSKKKIVILLIIMLIIVLWISKVIPMGIARIYGTIYMDKHFPELQLKYDNIEWSKYHNEYIIRFKDKDGKIHGFTIGPKYFPVFLGEGLFQLYEDSMNQNSTENNKILNQTVEQENISQITMKAVVIKVQEDYLYVMELDNQNSLLYLSLKNFNYDRFKMGQEILVYYDGCILETYPGQIRNIEKIEITNEKSNIQIPDKYLRFCYNSSDNVEISIAEINNNGMDIIIKDTNDLQYVYSNHYIIQRKVKNENYTGVSETIGKNTSNSIAPSTRNRIRIYLQRFRNNIRCS